MAVARPVTRFVAPGPLVTRQTPTFPGSSCIGIRLHGQVPLLMPWQDYSRNESCLYKFVTDINGTCLQDNRTEYLLLLLCKAFTNNLLPLISLHKSSSSFNIPRFCFVMNIQQSMHFPSDIEKRPKRNSLGRIYHPCYHLNSENSLCTHVNTGNHNDYPILLPCNVGTDVEVVLRSCNYRCFLSKALSSTHLFGSLLRGYFHKPFMKTYTTRLLS